MYGHRVALNAEVSIVRCLFAGVFRDPHGNAIDLRPEEGRPSYRNARQLSELELLQLIAKAIRGQMTDLKTSPFDETALQRALQQVGSLRLQENQNIFLRVFSLLTL